MKEKLLYALSILGIGVILFFGSQIAKRAYDRDIIPPPQYSQGQCVKMVYREHGRHAMIDKTEGQYVVKFYQEVPMWSYDFFGKRLYTPHNEIVETKTYTIREGNQFFEEVACPNKIVEDVDG